MCSDAPSEGHDERHNVHNFTCAHLLRLCRMRLHVYLFAVVAAAHCAILAWSATTHSPTYDELYHLVAGISHWRNGTFDLSVANPPLVRLVAGFAASLDHTVILPPYHSRVWRADRELAERFMHANKARCFRLIVLARWSCIPFSLIGAYACFAWARDLWGPVSGLFASMLWCVSPNILAHAELITSDVGAASLSVLFCYCLWRWSIYHTAYSTVCAAIALGLAQLTKYTCLFLYPLLFAFSLLSCCSCNWRH